MQTIQTWLWPRHYSMYSRRTRRLDWAALTALLIILFGTFSGAKMVRAWRTDQAAEKAVSQPAALAGLLKELQNDNNSGVPQEAASFTALQPKVQAWVNANDSAQWGVVVQDLANPDNKISINASAPFQSASLYKLFLTIPLTSKLPFSSWQTTQTLNGQGDRNYRQCVHDMLAYSDNACGEAIGDYLSWQKATQAIQAAGFSGGTQFNTANMTTTADDTAQYFMGLARGSWFDAPTRQFILESLAEQTHRDGIPAGCAGCAVLNKTGELDHVTNDAAIIYKGNTHYVLSIVSKDGNFNQIADLTKLINSNLP